MYTKSLPVASTKSTVYKPHSTGNSESISDHTIHSASVASLDSSYSNLGIE